MLDALELRTLATVASDSDRWIQAMRYSPDGALLATGSHDGKIRVYDCARGYTLVWLLLSSLLHTHALSFAAAMRPFMRDEYDVV